MTLYKEGIVFNIHRRKKQTTKTVIISSGKERRVVSERDCEL